MGVVLIYIGAVISVVWGISHIIPVKGVIKGFEPISADNRRIITMEWTAEGLTLIFIGILASIVTAAGSFDNDVTLLVLRSEAVMLVIMALLTLFTGARTRIIPIKLCPVVKSIIAVLFIIGSIIK